MSRQPVTAPLAIAMVKALEKGCQTYDELVAVSGLKKPTVARWIKALRDARVKGVYVEQWVEDVNGRLFVPCFRWGERPDAKRPGRSLTSAERMRALRASRKAGP